MGGGISYGRPFSASRRIPCEKTALSMHVRALPLPHLLCAQRIDDRALAHIWVADEADADGLFVASKASQLTQQGQQGTLAKRVGDAGMESQGWKLT